MTTPTVQNITVNAPAVVVPKPRRGVKTSELYVTLTPMILTALTFVFHKDFSGYVQAAGVAVSGISAAVYALSRAHLKRPVDLASALYDLKAVLAEVPKK